VNQGAMQTALSHLCNRGGFDIPLPAVDLDIGVPSQSPSAEESETESRVHLDNIPVAVPDDPVVTPIRSGFVSTPLSLGVDVQVVIEKSSRLHHDRFWAPKMLH